ncbi:hypothetical protein BH24GEM2_BH24GEM2_08730 [soil metagenome]
MAFVCLWSPDWRTGAGPAPELAERLLEVVPRVRVEQVLWADARGLPALELAEALRARIGASARAGIAAAPVAAEVAARGREDPVTWVEPGTERAFLAPYPVTLLSPEPRLLALLKGVGVTRCGELAALEREALEVRFGPPVVELWRRARADDRRQLFAPIPRLLPLASLDWTDYVLTDPERLVFTANALLGSVCAALEERGEGTRHMTLAFALANDTVAHEALRTARTTAARPIWLRRIRTLLERLVLPDAVVGLSLQVEATEPVVGKQVDLFDQGLASTDAAEAALFRLLDDQGPVVVAPHTNRHPLVERRTQWMVWEPGESVSSSPSSPDPHLSLHLLPEPLQVKVEARPRRDHLVPSRYCEGGTAWLELVAVAGPDRTSGGQWEDEPYAREYFRCVTREGMLVWLFRDARRDAWFLHGWWN